MLKFHRAHPARSLHEALRRAVIKAVAVSAALVCGYVSAAVFADFHRTPSDDVVAADQAAARLFAEHQCTPGRVVGPSARSAVVRVDGEIVRVGLPEARAVSEGRRPGTLVAICRSPLD